ncbi:MAG: general secretion pathway protein GspF [Thalassolituus sp.]|nr:MAG: general secretion pathway protein GspF [Thalassolituus sp.]
MLIKKARNKSHALDAPLFHDDHSKPRTRREFISQGFMAGGASVFGASALSLFANPKMAYGALSSDLEALKASCGIATQGAGKIPFICFDLAGGANIAGSNVLVGGRDGQKDFLNTAGYSKLGLPPDMIPAAPNMASASGDHTNEDLGLAFHTDSGFLRGILERTSVGTQANINGAVIPARSENDTGNNPHNPMYGIYRAGADGSLLSLIGSRSSESGGNSMAPMQWMDNSVRPTKVDRPSDVTGLVDVGDLVGLLDQSDAVAVMESIQRISDAKMNQVNAYSEVTANDVVKDLVRCGYVKSADIADRFGDPTTLNPEADPDIVGPAGIFTSAEFNSDGEFRKTASVMKLVINGFAGAGTVTMGGFDYHTGERGTGESRDLRAGRCMGACLEYAARVGVPLMLYVCSDGSVASNGRIDDSEAGRGKGEWTGDNQSTASSFFLVYNPGSRPVAIRNQIGHMRSDASVETSATPAANNVNQLVQTVLLNYMALHGEEGNFDTRFNGHGLGNSAVQDTLMGFGQLSSISGGIISTGT